MSVSQSLTPAYGDPSPIVPDPAAFNLSVPEGIQIYNFYIAFLRHLEDQFFSDLPETDRFALESQVRVIKSAPYGVEFWRVSKSIFNDRFQQYFDSLRLEDDPRLSG